MEVLIIFEEVARAHHLNDGKRYWYSLGNKALSLVFNQPIHVLRSNYIKNYLHQEGILLSNELCLNDAKGE